MFKQRAPLPLLRGLYFILWAILTWRLVQILMGPFLGEDLAFAFRSDNFFSFSGGHIRRGLIGEVLLQLQKLGAPAIFLYSLLLLLLFAGLYLLVFPKLLRSFRPLEVLLILLSGFFLMPGLDRELFMLLPAVYYFFRQRLDGGFFLLLGLVAFIHEMALLLYFPIIWFALRQMRHKLTSAQALYAIPVILAYGAVIVLKGDLNLSPEKTFWPQYGVEGLENRILYTFAGKGLLATLKLHGSIILGKVETLYALPGLLSFFVLVFLLFRRFGASAISLAYYLAITALFFVLSIDYGRYYYFLFFFFLLLTQSGLLLKAEIALADFNFLLPKFLRPWLNLDFSHRHFLAFLLIFALAPFGYWLGDTILEPAFWQEVQQFIQFEMPKYAGE